MKNNKSVESQIESLSNKIDISLKKKQREEVFVLNANLKFEENLLSFKKFFPEIFDKFLNYIPDDKFNLIVNDNGSANIIDYETGIPMYSDDPVSQISNQVNENIKNPILGKTDHSSIAGIGNSLNFLHIDLMNSMGEIFSEAKKSLKPNDSLDNKIPSMMIFGIGLGYHLRQLIENRTIGFINIIEPNEDLFFASLFVADWKIILESIDSNGAFLYLGIGKLEEEVFRDIYDRSRNVGIASVSYVWFYQHYPSHKMNKWIEEFRINFHQFFTGFGFFDDALMGIAHTLGNLENKFNLMNTHDSISKEIANFPVVIIANGPSLDQEIESLKALQDKVVIFSCNSASTALVKKGIVPDFHVALERTEATHDFLRDFLPAEIRQKINLLVTNVMHPKVASLFPWTGFGLKGNESGSHLIQLSQLVNRKPITEILSFCNPLVGNTALSYVCHLGFKNIYLFGVDNGYIDEQHHHSKSSFYYNSSGKTKIQPLKIGKQVEIPGNFVPTILTDAFMSVGNTQMEKLLESFKERSINCYNCSNGAKIKGTTPLGSDSIYIEPNKLSKKQVVEYVKENCFSSRCAYEDVEPLLNFEEFSGFCNTMAEILKQNSVNRTNSFDNLLESIRYLYSFKGSAKHLHIFLLFEGEVLYASSLLISLLYNFGDDEEILIYYNKALEYWISFIENAPIYYKENFRVCK
ncbi:6-hydroxymethylpterin diphosphokinase MptE-like protein [Marinomonas sp. 2405UD68-3]|uniref:motility associated factor glycosyltransferase family protein n=1 Tax=Marinomonas sp. 2405UD68-3 TaxID=3391835 RepID=UPI0039C95016